MGSRHLQALAKLEEPAHITVIDPSQVSLETCRVRMCEIAGWDRHTVVFQQKIEILSPVNFAVVATSANVRRQVVEEFLSVAEVKNLLLEKVLFQRASDCAEVGTMLQNHGVKAWVNAPRRMWPFYRRLKKELENDRIISFKQGGSGWGLACNAYHFLDLFSFLAGRRVEILSADLIDRQVLESKRSGFKELSGTLVGGLDGGCFFSISDTFGAQVPASVLIETEKRVIRIDETARTVAVIAGSPLPVDLIPEPKYQSELTHLFVQDVLTGGPGALALYEDASDSHQQMLKCYASIFSQGADRETALCPIT